MLAVLVMTGMAACGVALAQHSQKALTNEDAIKMVQAGLSESVIVAGEVRKRTLAANKFRLGSLALDSGSMVTK